MDFTWKFSKKIVLRDINNSNNQKHNFFLTEENMNMIVFVYFFIWHQSSIEWVII